MSAYAEAEEILKTMLSKLGFEVSIEIIEEGEGVVFNMNSSDNVTLIGKNGDRLEDIQYLLNRILMESESNLPRIKVDCDLYRKNQEAHLLESVLNLAEKVRETGNPAKTRPLNSYYRRIVHNAFTTIDDISTSSIDADSRFKRVVISLA